MFTAKLVSRQEVAAGTMAFRFAKPPGWTFEAGQFIDMDLIDPPRTDAEGNTRGFSMKGMQAVLKATGVDSDDIQVEEFTGY